MHCDFDSNIYIALPSKGYPCCFDIVITAHIFAKINAIYLIWFISFLIGHLDVIYYCLSVSTCKNNVIYLIASHL